MEINFVKMHGLGNDFLVIDEATAVVDAVGRMRRGLLRGVMVLVVIRFC